MFNRVNGSHLGAVCTCVCVCVVRDGSPSRDKAASYALMSDLRVRLPQGQVSHLICSLDVCVCV